MKKLLILVLTTCLGAATVFAGDGLCLWERWDTQTGGVDEMLTRTTAPAESKLLTKTEWGRDGVDPDLSEYLARITLWLEPPATGNYQFRIATDDNARLWLSNDANPGNAVRIAGYDGWANIDTWNSYSTQTSAWIPLEAGKLYFLRGANNEGGGGDHIHMQWQGPGFGWQDISGPVMNSALPFDIEWGGERLVEYDVWAQTNSGDGATSGFLAAEYTSLGYDNTAFPPLDEVLSIEGNPDLSGYLNTFTLAGAGAPADYFVTRHRGILKLDTAGMLGLAVSSDDGGLGFVGNWWEWAGAPETPMVVDNDGLHGMRWRGGIVEDVPAGYVGIETWQYEHGGGEGLDAAYWTTGMGRTGFGVKNLVSRIDASMHSPVNGAMNVPLDAVLAWEPPFGAEAPQFKVYVWEQGAAQGAGVLTSDTTFDPALDLSTAYWWQVNTFDPNEGGNPFEIDGKKLAFMTASADVIITAQPQGGGVDLGSDIELSVEAASAVMPLSYQWKKDGADISGADQSTYTVSSMERSDNGVYSCVVSNGTASAESAGARVFLKELMAYWPLDGDLNDHAEEIDPAAMGDKDAVYMVNDPNLADPSDAPDTTVPYIAGRVGSAIDFNGVDNFASAGTWNPSAASGQLTVEFWTRWDGDEGHWAGPIGKRDTWNSAEMMWQIEIDNGSDRLKTLQSNGGGGGYQTVRLPASNGINVAAGAIITASAEHPTNRDEAAWRAFDSQYNTKWLAFFNTGWLQATFADKKQHVVTSYTITSGNDAPDRDPDDWKLLGSNDGVTWDTLDTQVGQAGVWTARNQTVTFDLSSNTTAYRMYRLDISKNRNPGVNLIQISELELFVADPIGEDAWVHVAMVYDGAAATLYLNGLRVASQGMALDGDTEANLVFGACEANPTGGPAEGSKPWAGNLYGGAMDEVKIYNYPLTAEEVLLSYFAVADGDPVCLAGTSPAMDADGNCVVDLADLVLLVSQWLQNNSAE